MASLLLTTKNAKETKKHCRKRHFTKERPVLSKITKNIVAAFHFWRKIEERVQRIFFRSFRQNVYVLWALYITGKFSCFLFISLLIYSTLYTTTKYIIFKCKSRVFRQDVSLIWYNEVFNRCVKNASDSFHADGHEQDVCLALRRIFFWHLASLSLACRQPIRLVSVNTPSMSNFCISLIYSCLCVSDIAMQFHFLHFIRQKQVLTTDIAMLLSHNSV